MRIAKLLVGGVLATIPMGAAKLTNRIAVSGDSMRPALLPGDRLLLRRTRHPLPGHILALRDPRVVLVRAEQQLARVGARQPQVPRNRGRD